MEIPGKLIVVGALGCAIGGAFIDHEYNAREVVTTVTKDRVVTQYKTITQTHEVDKPDGTKEIDKTTTENGTQSQDIVQKIVDAKAAQASLYLAAVGMGLNANRVKIYSVSVDRKLLGPLSLGAYITTGSEAGLRIGVAF